MSYRYFMNSHNSLHYIKCKLVCIFHGVLSVELLEVMHILSSTVLSTNPLYSLLNHTRILIHYLQHISFLF